MTRLPDVLRAQVPANDHPFWPDLAQPGGRLHPLFQKLVHPPLLVRRGWRQTDRLHQATRLVTPLRELTRRTVGQLIQDEEASVSQVALAQRLGGHLAQRARGAPWARDPTLMAEARAVIRYATEATRAVRVTETTWHALQQCLDDGAILELVLTVAFDNMVAQVLVPLEREGESEAQDTRDTWGAHGEGG